MKHGFALHVFCLLLLARAATADAQVLPVRVGVEIRAAAVMPLGPLAERIGAPDRPHGLATGLAAHVDVLPQLGLYAGGQQVRFNCAHCPDLDLDEVVRGEAVEAGVRVMLPYRAGRLTPWLQVGGIRERLVLSHDGETMASVPGTGFSTRAGITTRVGRFDVSPGLTYQSVPIRFAYSGFPGHGVRLRRGGVDIGLALRI